MNYAERRAREHTRRMGEADFAAVTGRFAVRVRLGQARAWALVAKPDEPRERVAKLWVRAWGSTLIEIAEQLAKDDARIAEKLAAWKERKDV